MRRPRRGEPASLDAGFERSDYGQKAIAARLVATLPHRHVARQWFRSPDVLALLPFDRPEAERSYALVWSLPAERADALLAMEPAAFEAELGEAAGAEVGALRLGSERAAWPLVVGGAATWCGPGLGRWSATPPTSFIRSPGRVSTSASPTSPRSPPSSPGASRGAASATNGCCGGTYGSAPRRPGR